MTINGNPKYKELFEQFKSFEEQYGRIALLYRLGISYETSNSTLSQPSLPSLTK